MENFLDTDFDAPFMWCECSGAGKVQFKSVSLAQKLRKFDNSISIEMAFGGSAVFVVIMATFHILLGW